MSGQGTSQTWGPLRGPRTLYASRYALHGSHLRSWFESGPGSQLSIPPLPVCSFRGRKRPEKQGPLLRSRPKMSRGFRVAAGAKLGALPSIASDGAPMEKRVPLTDAKIRAASPQQRPVKLFDGGGLYLLVNPNGSRYWRMKYRFAGREGKLAFGVYPEVSLKEARTRRDEARRQIRDGIDPQVQRKAARIVQARTFQAVADEWLHLLAHPPVNPRAKRMQRTALASTTIERKRGWLADFVFPYIGARPIAEITAPELLEVLRRVERRGILETTHRVRSTCSLVFRYAVATSKCERDPAADLKGALTPVVVTHHAALTDPRAVGDLLNAIDAYQGQPATKIALQLLPMVFLRSRELRWSEWTEIDFKAAEWRVPPHRMKMREMHIVPLADKAITLLRELQPITGAGRLIFPGLRGVDRPISENTINGALRRLGYSREEMTGHGFRTIASTFLNEQGWDKDLIELQLAHSERDETRAAYNRAQRLADRRKMMQAWADYLDGLKAGGNVISIRRSG